MDPMTLFFAKLFGLASLFIGITAAFQRKHYRSALKHFYKNDALLFVTGMLVFFAGLIVILLHNHWGTPLEVIISLTAVGALLEGGLYLAMPEQMYGLFKRMINKSTYYFAIVSFLLLGAYLTYQGFVLA